MTKTLRVSVWEKILVIIGFLLTFGAYIPLWYLIRHPDQAGSLRAAQSPFLIIGIVYLITSIIVLARFQCYKQNLRFMYPLVIFLAWICLSVIWSPDKGLTAWRSLALVGAMLFGFYLASTFSLDDQLDLIYWAILIALLSSIVLCIIWPNYGVMTGFHEGRWRGVFTHKNVLGRIAVLFVLVVTLHKDFSRDKILSKILRVLLFSMGIMLTFLSGSAGAVVSLSILLSFIVLLVIVIKKKVLYVPLWASMLCLGLGSATLAIGNVSVVFAALGRSSNLTGRIPLWESLLPLIKQKLFLGFGYGAFWRGFDGPSALVWKAIGWHPIHAHNGFLDILLDSGVVGFSIFTFGYLLLFVKAIKRTRYALYLFEVWPLVYLVFLLIYDLTESTLIWYFPFFWIIYASMFVNLAKYSDDCKMPVKT